MNGLIKEKSQEQWLEEHPIIEQIMETEPVLWLNDRKSKSVDALSMLSITIKDMEDAEKRWRRFAPMMEKMFIETVENKGIIESNLIKIPAMKGFIENEYNSNIEGGLYIKCDSHLPVAGSIKARGGIYEVLKHAEKLAMGKGMLSEEDDYSIMADDRFKKFFSQYSLAVGSTGNLGLSIGIMGSTLGFKVTVHMSADAKQWKKDLLRSKGVKVVEYSSDYSKAVAEGRKESNMDPMSYFIDDENSKDLFLGYSVAAYRLKNQLDGMNIIVDNKHPLFVYLPCGVGGAPGGICFGLKNVFGDNVHCFFIEPTHSPCMLLGLITGLHENISVQDFGIDNRTDADGLAVGTPSGFAGKIIERLISGVLTVQDDELYRLLASLKDTEDIKIEPSAAASLFGPYMIYADEKGASYMRNEGIKDNMKSSTHIAWATGGLFVPEELMVEFYNKGKEMIK